MTCTLKLHDFFGNQLETKIQLDHTSNFNQTTLYNVTIIRLHLESRDSRNDMCTFKCFVVSKLRYNMFEADVHTVLFNSCSSSISEFPLFHLSGKCQQTAGGCG